MGIFMATQGFSNLIYYIKKQTTYIIETTVNGEPLAFQILNEKVEVDDLKNSGLSFNPISNKEFEEYLVKFKGVIDYDLLGLKVKKFAKEAESFDLNR